MGFDEILVAEDATRSESAAVEGGRGDNINTIHIFARSETRSLKEEDIQSLDRRQVSVSTVGACGWFFYEANVFFATIGSVTCQRCLHQRRALREKKGGAGK